MLYWQLELEGTGNGYKPTGSHCPYISFIPVHTTSCFTTDMHFLFLTSCYWLLASLFPCVPSFCCFILSNEHCGPINRAFSKWNPGSLPAWKTPWMFKNSEIRITSTKWWRDPSSWIHEFRNKTDRLSEFHLEKPLMATVIFVLIVNGQTF